MVDYRSYGDDMVSLPSCSMPMHGNYVHQFQNHSYSSS